MKKEKQIEKLISLGLKAIFYKPNIKSGYLIHRLFSYWKIPINFIAYLEILNDRGLIEKKFYDEENYIFFLTKEGRDLAIQVDVLELISNDFEFEKENILDFFNLSAGATSD